MGTYSAQHGKQMFITLSRILSEPQPFQPCLYICFAKAAREAFAGNPITAFGKLSSRFLLSPVPVDIEVQNAITFLPVKLLFLTKPSTTHAASRHQIG